LDGPRWYKFYTKLRGDQSAGSELKMETHTRAVWLSYKDDFLKIFLLVERKVHRNEHVWCVMKV
jgi:hypothetical protein